MTTLLSVTDVHAGYLPGVDILRGLSLEARANEITLVIGPNGAGKSTLLRTVFAFLAPNQGNITFAARPTAGLAPNLVEQVYDILLTAKQSSGVAILLVEQNVEQALPLADHLYLLNLGRVKAQGPGKEFDNTRIRALIQECLLG
jgi:ABC-type branched-subunit amino acid transport system ATPase component